MKATIRNALIVTVLALLAMSIAACFSDSAATEPDWDKGVLVLHEGSPAGGLISTGPHGVPARDSVYHMLTETGYLVSLRAGTSGPLRVAGVDAILYSQPACQGRGYIPEGATGAVVRENGLVFRMTGDDGQSALWQVAGGSPDLFYPAARWVQSDRECVEIQQPRQSAGLRISPNDPQQTGISESIMEGSLRLGFAGT